LDLRVLENDGIEGQIQVSALIIISILMIVAFIAQMLNW
jgi:hypothetical protein